MDELESRNLSDLIGEIIQKNVNVEEGELYSSAPENQIQEHAMNVDEDLVIAHAQDKRNQEHVTVRDEVNEEESICSNEYYSPGGSLYWVPTVPNHLKPNTETVYQSLKEVTDMYYLYALEGGFDVRKTTQRKEHGKTKLKYLVCNREGLPNTSSVDTLDDEKSKTKRRTSLIRRGCDACIKFHIVPGTESYKIYEFEEKHNHKLISKCNMNLTRTKRRLNLNQKSIIYKMSNQNVGATMCHRLFTGIEGGYNAVSATTNEFKNFWRDLNCFLAGSDAQMLVDKMICRKENIPNFSFEFSLEGRQLNALFWADETAKLHYKEFGDVVSFDATYSTNRYDMIFVPFTGIDNHKKCVTFGAGLLSNELTESYVWLLKAFKTAFVKPPLLVLSDQDPAMKKAIAEVLPTSNHRLCMWHITSKLSKKIDWDIFNKSDFKRRFNKLVWNSVLDENEFEEGWKLLINDFNMHEKRWFKDMYDLRRCWIPAFFKHVPMSGLMRTTSRSEGQNSSFQHTTQSGCMLVNFMNSFESSMEKQRYNQTILDFKTNQTEPKTKTFLKIEKHASKQYTRKVFFQVQHEIFQSLVSCTQQGVTNCGETEIYVIRERNGSKESIVNEDSDIDSDCEFLSNDAEFKVIYNSTDESFKCECMMFEHHGILCRHVFCVFRSVNYDEIPEKYILRRWRKDIIPTEILRKHFRYGDSSSNTEKLAIEVFSIVDHCVTALSYDEKKLEEYVKKQKELMNLVDAEEGGNDALDKNKAFEKLLGVSSPAVVDILNPGRVRTKGSGTRKRMKSSMEIAIEKSKKERRACGVCKKKDGHNARSCPQRTKGD